MAAEALLDEAVALIEFVSGAETEAQINRHQSSFVASVCSHAQFYIQVWLRDFNLELRSRTELIQELLRVLRKCLKLVQSYKRPDWLKAVLFSQENELEFEQVVEDLSNCVDLIHQALVRDNEVYRLKSRWICSLRRNALDNATVYKEGLKFRAEQDRIVLRARLNRPRHGFSAEDSALMDLLLRKLNRDSSEVDAGIDIPTVRNLGQISRGSFGVVSKVECLGTSLAAKHTEDFHSLGRELAAMWKLRPGHPHVLQIVGKYGEDTLLMELCRTDLSQLIRANRSKPPFSLEVSVEIMLQIARGMEFLHRRNVLHRDLKPGNVMLNFEGSVFPYYEPAGEFCVKVIDFGRANSRLDNDGVYTYDAGTHKYMAPEVFGREGLEAGPYDHKVDVYSFAMTCSEIITGNVPFGEGVVWRSNLLSLICQGHRPHLSAADIPSELRSLITECWHLDAGRRPEFREIVSRLLSVKSALLLHHSPLSQSPSSPSPNCSGELPATPVVRRAPPRAPPGETAGVGVRDSRLEGNSDVGEKLVLHGELEAGTSYCICRWTRCTGSNPIVLAVELMMEGCRRPTYTITVDDYKSTIGVELLPIEWPTVFEPVRVTPEVGLRGSMRQQVQRKLQDKYAEFPIKGRRLEMPTLRLRQADFVLWRNMGGKNTTWKYHEVEAVEVLGEDGASVKMRNGDACEFRFKDSMTRDIAVLTLRGLIGMA